MKSLLALALLVSALPGCVVVPVAPRPAYVAAPRVYVEPPPVVVYRPYRYWR